MNPIVLNIELSLTKSGFPVWYYIRVKYKHYLEETYGHVKPIDDVQVPVSRPKFDLHVNIPFLANIGIVDQIELLTQRIPLIASNLHILCPVVFADLLLVLDHGVGVIQSHRNLELSFPLQRIVLEQWVDLDQQILVFVAQAFYERRVNLVVPKVPSKAQIVVCYSIVRAVVILDPDVLVVVY